MLPAGSPAASRQIGAGRPAEETVSAEYDDASDDSKHS
jgi:hypothetical protein